MSKIINNENKTQLEELLKIISKNKSLEIDSRNNKIIISLKNRSFKKNTLLDLIKIFLINGITFKWIKRSLIVLVLLVISVQYTNLNDSFIINILLGFSTLIACFGFLKTSIKTDYSEEKQF